MLVTFKLFKTLILQYCIWVEADRITRVVSDLKLFFYENLAKFKQRSNLLLKTFADDFEYKKPKIKKNRTFFQCNVSKLSQNFSLTSKSFFKD